MRNLAAILLCAVFASAAAEYNKTVILTPLASTAIQVQWHHWTVPSEVSSYKIQYVQGQDGVRQVDGQDGQDPTWVPAPRWNRASEMSMHANRRRVVLYGLKPDTTYLVRVKVALASGPDRVVSGTYAVTTTNDKSWASIERLFLHQMQSHIDSSLTNLFTSFRMKSSVMQRPGLAKLLREESDRHWERGFSYAKKYFQREGQFNTQFTDFFNFHGNNPKVPENKVGQDATENKYSKFYTSQFGSLVGGVEADNHRVNEIYHHHVIRVDPDYAHFVQEKAEGERSVLRNLQILKKNLDGLHGNGMALHLFDKAL